MGSQGPTAEFPISQVRAAGSHLYIAGQIGADPETGAIPGEFSEQVSLAMENLGRRLESAGASFADVVMATIFIARRSDFAAMNEVYQRYFSAPPFPARATIVSELAFPELLFEILAVAYRPAEEG